MSKSRESHADLLTHYTTLSKSLPALLAESRDPDSPKQLHEVINNVLNQMQAILVKLIAITETVHTDAEMTRHIMQKLCDIVEGSDRAPHYAELGDFLAVTLAEFLRLYKLTKKPLGIYTVLSVQVIGSEITIKVEDENNHIWDFGYQIHNFSKNLLEEQLRSEERIVPSNILDV